MAYGYGFGFMGSSPSWPYVGRGRGGLPRWGYPGALTAAPYPFCGAGWGTPYYGMAPFTPQVAPEQELDFLKSQAQAIRGQLEQIEARVRELASEKE